MQARVHKIQSHHRHGCGKADWMFTERPTTFPDSPSANCPEQQILDETEKAGEGLSGRIQILALFLPQMIF